MTDDEIYAELTEVFRDVFMRDDLTPTPEMSANDVSGWDSFKQVEIIMAVEERFGIKLTTRDMDGLRRVGDLAALVASKAVPRGG